ncbi:MAG: hypothetical protein HFJ29_04485 [Clostridia bacterium]|nr:hypothetical protein [Clostridia bacterium]
MGEKTDYIISIPEMLVCYLFPIIGIIICICNIGRNKQYAEEWGITSLLAISEYIMISLIIMAIMFYIKLIGI